MESFHFSVRYSNIPFINLVSETPCEKSSQQHLSEPNAKQEVFDIILEDPSKSMTIWFPCNPCHNTLYLPPNTYSSVPQALAFATPHILPFFPHFHHTLLPHLQILTVNTFFRQLWKTCRQRFKLERFQDFLNTNKAPAKWKPETAQVAPPTSAVWMTSLSTTSWSTASSTLKYMPTARWPRFSVCSRSSKKEGQRDG